MLAKAMNWTTSFLEGLEIGQIVPVAEVRVRNKPLLVECVKQYIDWYGGFEFSSDYAAIKRLIPVNWEEVKALNVSKNGSTKTTQWNATECSNLSPIAR